MGRNCLPRPFGGRLVRTRSGPGAPSASRNEGFCGQSHWRGDRYRDRAFGSPAVSVATRLTRPLLSRLAAHKSAISPAISHNTRYQADATPYLGRTCTGWIAPACGWRIYSITSSARASSVGGMVMPSALAVLRFTVSSYLVGRCTGRSPGFSPLRIRST